MSSFWLSRRTLLLGAGAGILKRGAPASPPLRAAHFPGRVGTALSTPAADVAAVAESLARALTRAVPGAESAAAAVAQLFRPSDTVGLKVNCLAGPHLSPRPVLVDALASLLSEHGIAPSQIIVFDRSSSEMERAGFRLRRAGGGYLCFGIDNDYDPDPTESGEIGSCFARLVSSTCTALVSVGVVKDHDLAGVSAGLKNWYGVIHNPNKYHDNNCDPYVADVVRHPLIRRKLRLTLLDGTRAQCHGGPAYAASGRFVLDQTAVSTDPVAADLWAWQVIEAERKKRGMPTLEAEERAPKFLLSAAKYGLGIADPEKLQVVSA